MPGLSVGLLVAILLGLAVLLALYIADRREAKREQVLMEKMRRSPMYQEMYQVIRRCRKRHVEQIRIAREGVTFTMMLPAGRQVHFSFAEKKYMALSPRRIRVLCLLIGQDLDVVRDKGRYRLRRRRVTLENGEKSVVYTYTMLPMYKDALHRVPYYL